MVFDIWDFGEAFEASAATLMRSSMTSV